MNKLKKSLSIGLAALMCLSPVVLSAEQAYASTPQYTVKSTQYKREYNGKPQKCSYIAVYNKHGKRVNNVRYKAVGGTKAAKSVGKYSTTYEIRLPNKKTFRSKNNWYITPRESDYNVSTTYKSFKINKTKQTINYAKGEISGYIVKIYDQTHNKTIKNITYPSVIKRSFSATPNTNYTITITPYAKYKKEKICATSNVIFFNTRLPKPRLFVVNYKDSKKSNVYVKYNQNTTGLIVQSSRDKNFKTSLKTHYSKSFTKASSPVVHGGKVLLISQNGGSLSNKLQVNKNKYIRTRYTLKTKVHGKTVTYYSPWSTTVKIK